MSDEQLLNRWLGKTDSGKNTRVGGGWAVVWLTSPPPPIDTKANSYLPERPVVAPPMTWEDVAKENEEQGGNLDPLAEVVGDGNILYPNGFNPDTLKPKMRYWIDGEEIDRPMAMAYLNRFAAEFADDSGRPFISVVSDDKEVAAKVKSALAPYLSKLHVQVFRTDSWVSKQRLKAKLTAQLPTDQGGKTVYASDNVDEESLVKAAKAALGIVDPPPIAPEPPKPEPAPKPAPDDKAPVPAPVVIRLEWLIASLLGAYLLLRPRK
jgi:hypothetical protein